jgi:hypothetical protein
MVHLRFSMLPFSFGLNVALCATQVGALMDGGELLEDALDMLLTEAQLLWLRGELYTDKGLLKQALDSFQASEILSKKLSDDAAVSRCLRYVY